MRRSAAVLAAVVVGAACTDTSTAPAEVEVAPAFARSASAPVHRASGGGQLDISVLGFPNEQYGFTALVDANGNATGQLHAHFSIPDVTFHATVNCLSVAGNEAWIGAVVSGVNPVYPVGTHVAFKVRDNGQGAAAPPDEMSYFFLSSAAPGTCDFHASEVFMFPWANGNIQVQ